MVEPSYPVRDVSAWPVAVNEPTGVDEKEWLAEPGSQRRWLFKPVTVHEWGLQGEDWAELLVAELGMQLGVPCATVALATRNDRTGSISLNLRPEGWEMQPGAVLLSEHDSNYRPGWENVRGRPGHSLSSIKSALRGYGAPTQGALPFDLDAFGVFCGYLILDALAANRDRHDENWAVLRPQLEEATPTLAGSFDHAGSLGYNLPDEERVRMLDEGRVRRWVERGTAWRFEHTPGAPPTLVELARDGLRLAGKEVRWLWLSRVEGLNVTTVTLMLRRVPGLSDPAARFAEQVVRMNRERVLDEC